MVKWPRYRRVVCALLASILLHLLGMVLVRSFLSRPVELKRFRVASLSPGVPVHPYLSSPPVPLSRDLLERLRAEIGSPLWEAGVVWSVAGEGVSVPEPALPGEEALVLPGKERGEWIPFRDALAAPLLRVQADYGFPLSDPVALEAEARQRSVIVVDPKTRGLRWARLHLPVYRSDSSSTCANRGAQEAAGIFDLLERGYKVPFPAPISVTLHLIRLGGCGLPHSDDPLHRFIDYPSRHLLRQEEMKAYPVLNLKWIDVESTETMVHYLMEEGFTLVDRGQLRRLQKGLQTKVGARMRSVIVDLSHPLFHCFYDVKRYREGTKTGCSPVAPLPGLELDGRLCAVVVPPFNQGLPCPANKLYVNALVYGLVQPSSMGGRYVWWNAVKGK